MQFEILYTTMKTGDFTDNTGTTFFLVTMYPLVLFMLTSGLMNLAELADEEHELKIFMMLKRNGMKEVVDIMKQIVLFIPPALIASIILSVFLHFLGMNFISIPLLFLMILNFSLTLMTFDLLVNNALRG